MGGQGAAGDMFSPEEEGAETSSPEDPEDQLPKLLPPGQDTWLTSQTLSISS